MTKPTRALMAASIVVLTLVAGAGPVSAAPAPATTSPSSNLTFAEVGTLAAVLGLTFAEVG